ncbi:kinase-like domain-containing protein [Bombardia bombarda]|uniref:Kinase-like domain-containing protein n=1 Tax=Bombardia bombarda TaxID=252184 RepID=A0AA39XL91_9PEZI|nr:kinase-like domain-containing protein [Bombardia bombarda]
MITFIVMEFVPGASLRSSWSTLTEEEKSGVSEQLQQYFSQLRQIPAPDFYGNINGGHILDELFDSREGNKEITGPFETDDQFINGVIQKYIVEGGPRLLHKAQYYRRALSTALQTGNKPVFTHCDFQRKNIMLQPDGKVVIIDWEFSGWYPRYWEFSNAMFANGGWEDEWHLYVARVLDEYPTEAIWLTTLRLDIWS